LSLDRAIDTMLVIASPYACELLVEPGGYPMDDFEAQRQSGTNTEMRASGPTSRVTCP
jgi:hypothetical protein